jgi:glycosyltransferase involved in cell wall biosynthesis
MKPLVSVLMTAYNREKFIAEAIESVLASTYKNFELVIVDDCSKDSTVEIARRYEAKDVRVKVYVNEQNLGDYPNRNRAASYAKGKYLKYIDADDAIYYYGLQVVVELMERFPEAGYGLDSIRQDDYKIAPYLLGPKDAYEAHYLKKMGLFDKAPTSCIIRSEVFNEAKGFKPERMVGDCEMWHRLSLHYTLLIIPGAVVWSRGHLNSESGKWMSDLTTIYHYSLISRAFLSNQQCPIPKILTKKLIANIVFRQFSLLIKAIIRFDFDSYKSIKKLDPIGIVELLSLKIK